MDAHQVDINIVEIWSRFYYIVCWLSKTKIYSPGSSAKCIDISSTSKLVHPHVVSLHSRKHSQRKNILRHKKGTQYSGLQVWRTLHQWSRRHLVHRRSPPQNALPKRKKTKVRQWQGKNHWQDRSTVLCFVQIWGQIRKTKLLWRAAWVY